VKQKFDIQIQVRIQEYSEGGGYRGQGLEVNETVSVEASGFMDICQVLSRFHELASVIRKERGIKK
jgi:hypothetical protein